MKYQGYLQPIIETLNEKKSTQHGRLTGQALFTNPSGPRALIAMDSKGFVHLLLAPCPASLGRLSRLKLRALSLDRKSWVVFGNPVDHYLDIKCTATTKSPLMTPFLGFCEDVIEEIEKGVLKPEDVVYKTWVRWRRFWSKEDGKPFTQEWLRGLLGEVLFLEALLKRYGEDSLGWWSGPEQQDHDFQIGRTVCEVKTSAKIPATVRINNLNQLDNDLVDRLFLACFHLSENDQGITLVEIVKRVEAMLKDEFLDTFLDKLAKVGYLRSNEGEYSAYRFEVSEPKIYRVDDRFPKITMSSLKRKLDARIVRVLYDLELTGLKMARFEGIEWKASKSRER